MEDTLGNFVVVVAPGVCRAVLVLVELVETAMELVGSGLGDGENFSSVHVTVFGIGVSGDDAHLANGFGSGVIGDGVLQRLIDVRAVEDVVIGLHSVAVEGRLGRRGKGRVTLCTLRAAQRTIGRQDCAGDEHRCGGEILPRKGHALEHIRGNGGSQRGVFCLKDGPGVGRNTNGCGHFSHLQLQVDPRDLVDFEGKRTIGRGVEACPLRGNNVGANGKGLDVIGAAMVGHRGGDNTRVHVPSGHRGLRDSSAGLIHHATADGARDRLCPCGHATRSDDQRHHCQPKCDPT